ncbi:hypothetical protein, partial [Candidatus Aeolococcus gillhamiae]|uniref:hypothetical protein n=1 Tax=Candidatus Aeolococcus gillhamiae TaxID=3127015 RepID=UPI003076CD3B
PGVHSVARIVGRERGATEGSKRAMSWHEIEPLLMELTSNNRRGAGLADAGTPLTADHPQIEVSR